MVVCVVYAYNLTQSLSPFPLFLHRTKNMQNSKNLNSVLDPSLSQKTAMQLISHETSESKHHNLHKRTSVKINLTQTSEWKKN